MLKVDIKKGTPEEKGRANIEANGSIPELLNDVAVLVSSVYNQFKAASPSAAVLFRRGLENMVKDPNSPMWTAVEGQSGIIIPKP